jgi:tetratricopeptide (TPR) repeat protein
MLAMVAAAAASPFNRPFTKELEEFFFLYPNMAMAFLAVGLSALIVATYWVMHGAGVGMSAGRQAIRAQSLKRQKDHRALILVGGIQGVGAKRVRQRLMAAVETHFGSFAFSAPVQVEPFPIRLQIISPKAHPEKIRRVGAQAVETLDRSAGDVIIWGKVYPFSDKVELRIVSAPQFGRVLETHAMTFRMKNGRIPPGVEEAIAYACARRARPVLNRPQDYKPEKLQPIVEALDKLVAEPPPGLADQAFLEVLGDFASGALSLGERGGAAHWLEKSLEARKQYLDRVDRTVDPGAWGAAQQEVGRALAALGEREGAREKLEEAVGVLKLSLDALRATESLQHAEVAMRALQRAEQTLAQRRRIGLRWPA